LLSKALLLFFRFALPLVQLILTLFFFPHLTLELSLVFFFFLSWSYLLCQLFTVVPESSVLTLNLYAESTIRCSAREALFLAL
jgi:hypothetical protein